MKRITYGEAEMVLQAFDVATLRLVREVALPPKFAMLYPYGSMLAESADGKYVYVQNATPATSVTVVDVVPVHDHLDRVRGVPLRRMGQRVVRVVDMHALVGVVQRFGDRVAAVFHPEVGLRESYASNRYVEQLRHCAEEPGVEGQRVEDRRIKRKDGPPVTSEHRRPVVGRGTCIECGGAGRVDHLGRE